MDKATKQILLTIIEELNQLRKLVDQDYYNIGSSHRSTNACIDMELDVLKKQVEGIEVTEE